MSRTNVIRLVIQTKRFPESLCVIGEVETDRTEGERYLRVCQPVVTALDFKVLPHRDAAVIDAALEVLKAIRRTLAAENFSDDRAVMEAHGINTQENGDVS